MVLTIMIPGIDYIGVGCGALIVNDKNETLLLKRGIKSKNQAGYWSKPGGMVEFGEKIEDAIKREIKEEFGVEIELIRFLGFTNNKDTVAYNNKTLEKNKYTYQEFLDLHPILFWKDPLGRWLRFININVDYAIELGKPVIYLYPEEKTRLTVKVAPNGGFITTDPPYGDGWEVEAEPNGQITDLKTGKNYDYLFWEGIGFDYPRKDFGWVAKKENLKNFFVEKLSILGLSKNEIAEFNDYWVKKLSKMPYYKIYFLTQNEFNKIAPLTISPKEPQSLIRVMMTAEGLSETRQIQEQKLPPTPERKGFTVVEWGGTLLR